MTAIRQEVKKNKNKKSPDGTGEYVNVWHTLFISFQFRINDMAEKYGNEDDEEIREAEALPSMSREGPAAPPPPPPPPALGISNNHEKKQVSKAQQIINDLLRRIRELENPKGKTT